MAILQLSAGNDYSTLLADDTCGVFVLGKTIEACNGQLSYLWGHDQNAIIGKTLQDFSPTVQPNGVPSLKALEARIQATQAGLPQSFEWQFRHMSGVLFDSQVSLELLTENDNDRLLGRIRDMTSPKRAQSAWRESEARLQQILNNTTAVVYIKDCDGCYLSINRQFERLFQLREVDVLGKQDHQVFPKMAADAFRRNDLAVLREKTALEFEETAWLDNGKRTYISNKFPLFNAQGEIYALCGISTDITERKRTEEALRNVALGVSGAQGSDVFREIVRYLTIALGVDSAFIGTLIQGTCERVCTLAVYDNGQFLENVEYDLAGTPCENVIGKQFEYIPTAAPLRYPGDGMLQALGFDSYTAYPLFDSQGKALGLIAALHRQPLHDRSLAESMLKIFSVRAAAEVERLRADEARRISEVSYQSIFEASEDAIFIHDIDTGAFVDVNPKACELYGYSYEEMKQIDVGQLSSGEYPYTRAEAKKLLEQAKAGQRLRFEWHRRNKDGSLHWDEVVLKRATIGGVDRILAVTREITGRKQAEAERTRLEAQLRQAQKMEAIGHLTGGIAHDFNNILTGVMGYIVLATERAEQMHDTKLDKYLERAFHSGKRARELIQQMLTFSRGQRGEPKPLSLRSLIKEFVKLLGSTLPSTIELEVELDIDTPPVLLDPIHVEQILMNLCINARDAMQSSGRIAIGLRGAAHENVVCASCHQTFSGSFVEITVRDSGPGIALAHRERIFEPFFSTKETGKGSGMGLSTVHGIVHEYGGHLLLHTAPGEGAEFRVLFKPLASTRLEAPDVAAQRKSNEKAPLLQGRALVVDDDEIAGDFMEDLLISWGLEVNLFRTSLEAREAFERNPHHFHLAVLDQTMPRMTGLELSRYFLEHRPDLPVILYTGYSDNLSEEQLASSGIRSLVKKPVDMVKFQTLIQDLLSARQIRSS